MTAQTRTTALLVTALLGSSLQPLAAQTVPLTVDQPVTITYYNYNLASAGIGGDATRRMIADFEAANPNIKVEGVAATAAELTSRVQADLAANRVPDVVQMVFSDLSYGIEALGAVALEDIIPQAELSAHFDGMSPRGLGLGRMNDKTWGLAYTFSTPVLFYNADLFKAAGLNPDAPPKTWAAVKEAALAIKDKTGKVGFGAGIFGPAAGDWLFQGVVRSNNGPVLSEDRKELTFASENAVAAVAMLRDLHDSGVYPNLETMAGLEAFYSGNMGMFLNTSAYQGAILRGSAGKYELRASTMPRFGDQPQRPNNSGSALVILSKDPLKQRAAWELMKHMTSKEAYTIITRDIGYLPLRTDIVDDPAYLADWVKDQPLVRPNLEQLEMLEPWTAFPGNNYRQIQKIMMEGAEMAVFGGMDPAEAMQAAQDTAQPMMPN